MSMVPFPLDLTTLGQVDYRPFADVAPFTIRSGATYESVLSSIRVWIRDTLVPYLSDESLSVVELQAAVNVMIDTLKAHGDFNDTILLAALQATVSQTRTWLDARYLNEVDRDHIIPDLFNTSSATQILLDGRYLNEVDKDHVIPDLLTAGGDTKNALDGRYALKTSNSGKNALTGWFHVTDYGAKGDGSTDDNGSIQSAVDAANAAYVSTGTRQRVFFPAGKYSVGAHNMVQSNSNVDGVCSIELKSGVELYGPNAVVKTKDHAYGNGAFYGIVRSKYTVLTDAGITELTFDGNRGNQIASTNAGNILLECSANVHVKDVTSIESNGNGIMLRGDAYGATMSNCSVKNCKVSGINGIGIQCAQFDGLQIIGNQVHDTSDNGIDIYGEHADHGPNSYGVNFQINDNAVRASALVGIFLETVSYGQVVGNRVSNCPVGIRTNRINATPTAINIVSNSMYGCTAGAAFSGDMEQINFSDNQIQGYSDAAIKFDGLRCSGVFGQANLCVPNDDSKPIILVSSYCQQIAYCYITQTMTRKSTTPTYVSYAGAAVSCSFPNAGGPGF